MSLLALLAVLTVPAPADTVYLKNGNTLEGVVTEQTATTLTLDFGYGSTVIDKSEVAKLLRSKKGAASKEIKRRRFESGRAVPEGAETLDKLYQAAQTAREQALDAQAQERVLDEEAASLTAELPDLKEKYQGLSKALQDYNAAANPRGYNELIGQLNAAGAAIQAGELRLPEIDRLKKECAAKVNGYLEAYRALEEYAAGEGAALLKKKETEYFAFLNDKLMVMSADFRRETVTPEKKGNGLYVDVLLNGKVHARMLVDTGASTTLIYKEAADKLALPPAARVGGSLTKVADGRVVPASAFRLESIAVGQSVVRGSVAAFVPVGGMGFDGLLGMSFLGRFIARVDAANGRLILEELKTTR